MKESCAWTTTPRRIRAAAWTVPPFGTAQGQFVIRSYMAVPVVSPTRGVLGVSSSGIGAPACFRAKHEQMAARYRLVGGAVSRQCPAAQSSSGCQPGQGRVSATLSHELRNPLNAMLGWAQVLRSGTLPLETQRRGLDSLERNAKAQALLIEDLLDVSTGRPWQAADQGR